MLALTVFAAEKPTPSAKSPAAASHKAEDNKVIADKKCRQWAVDDEIPPNELEKYVAECVKDLLTGAD